MADSSIGRTAWARGLLSLVVAAWVWDARPAAHAAWAIFGPAAGRWSPPPPAPVRPPVVLLIGDSNIFGSLGKALAQRLEQRGFVVHRRGKPTSGLSRRDFFDWPREATALIAATTPDLVLFMVGGNDHQRLESPGSSGTRIYWKEPEPWTAEYERRVREMADVLRGPGRRAFFLSPTNRAPRIDREDALRVSRIQAAALEGLDGIAWIDTFALTTDATGRWLEGTRDASGRSILFRHGDGIHLTREGGEFVADRVLAVIDQHGMLLCGPPVAAVHPPPPLPMRKRRGYPVLPAAAR